ncbi:hypothetical protein ACFQ8C_12345 [Streptomyces sp. NPDC056503]|uniref:hypothetical protein n=1 Tax=Streptomyces sp. NPDC056503 TaxID=3345842 RepID=UPI0036AB6698
MASQESELCRNCGEAITRFDGRWSHGRYGYGGWGTVGCSAYSFTLHGDWDSRLTKSEKASPRTRAQLAGREEFPAWPGLQQQRREAARKEQEAAALAATRFSTKLAKAIQAAESVAADPAHHTFRTLERRRQAVILAMEEQARSAAARNGHAEVGSGTVEDELARLMQLTQDVLRSLRTAEDLLPPAEALKAAASRYSARIDQITTDPYASKLRQADTAFTERRTLQAARQRTTRHKETSRPASAD